MKLRQLAVLAALCIAATTVFADNSKLNVYHCLSAMESRTITTDFGKFLQLDHCYLNDSDLLKVALYLKKHPDIKYLKLGHNPTIGLKGYSYLSTLQSLEYISLDHNDIDDSKLAAVLSNKNYRGIDLSYNSDLTADGLSSSLSGQSNLTTLFIDHSELRDDHAIKLANALKTKNFEILSVADNHIGASGASELAKLPLYGINLANNHVRDEGAVDIAKTSRIPVLYLKGNKITDKGAAAFATNWNPRQREVYYVPYLELSENSIGDEGALAFMNNELQYQFSLNIAFNTMSAGAVEALCYSSNIYYLIADDFTCENARLVKAKKLSFRERVKKVSLMPV